MNRQSYLADESVKRFVDGWLRPRVQGGIPFHHSYTNAQTGQAWRCESLWQAYELYQWNGKNFAENQCELDRLAQGMRRAMKEGDRRGFCRAAAGILKWGRVTRGNCEKLVERGADALPTFKRAADLLRPDTADTSNLGCIPFMNAGWTKVYALMLDDFPIYDGRVGAALGYCVRLHCREQGIASVPPSLRFRWGPSKGKHNRNPSVCGLKFPQLAASAPRAWAECNVRAAWVLNAVSGEGKFGSLEPKRRLRALEAALFMIGYELPTERRCSREC